MRTTGTFSDVYTAARDYYRDNSERNCPMEPVVRRLGNEWFLESGIEGHGVTDADGEWTLDAFDEYFYESYQDTDWLPSEADANEFRQAMDN